MRDEEITSAKQYRTHINDGYEIADGSLTTETGLFPSTLPPSRDGELAVLNRQIADMREKLDRITKAIADA